MTTWRTDIHNLNGSVLLSDAPVMDWTCSWVLNAPGSFEATLSLKNANVTRANFQPGQREVRVHRAGTLIWGGYLVGVSVELRDTVKIRAEGYLSRLRRRYVMNDLIYADTAQQTIAWNLIAHTQGLSSGDMAITQGSHTGATITRDRDYCAAQHPNVGGELDAFTGLDDGIDFDIGPSIGGSANKVFKTYYPRQGTDRSGTVTLNQAKLSSLSYDLSADDVVSRLITTGTGDCNPPEDDRTDSTALSNFGLLQAFESVEFGALRDVQAHGRETLRNRKDAQRLAVATLHESQFTFGDFEIGDRVTLASNRGPSGGFGNFSDIVRILGIELLAQAPGIVFYRLLLDSVVT